MEILLLTDGCKVNKMNMTEVTLIVITGVRGKAVPLSRRRQFLQLLFLHLLVHLGSFVEKAFEVSVGALKRGF